MIGISSPVLRAADTPLPPVKWQEVVEAKGNLAFVGKLTGYALTCHPKDLGAKLIKPEGLTDERAGIAVNLLMSAWLERAPDKALAYWKDHREQLPPGLQETFFNRLVAIDPSRAQKELAGIKDVEARRAYAGGMAGALAQKDPETALSIASTYDPDSALLILQMMARKSPLKAWDLTSRLPEEGGSRTRAQSSVLSIWFQTNPDAVIAWSRKVALPADVRNTLVSEFGNLTDRDWATAEKLLAVAPEEMRAELTQKFNTRLANASIPMLWELAKAGRWQPVNEETLYCMIHEIPDAKPAEQLAMLRSLPKDLYYWLDLTRVIGNTWALHDPEEGTQWAMGLSDDIRKSTLMQINTTDLAVNYALDKTLARIEKIPPGALHDALIGNAGLGLAYHDFPKAIAWLSAQPANAGRQEGFEQVIDLYSTRDLEGLRQNLDTFPEGKPRVTAYKVAGRQTAEVDIDAALKWYGTLPAGDLRSAARQGLSIPISMYAPDRFWSLLGDAKDKQEYNSMVQALKESTVENESEFAQAIEKILPDPELRKKFFLSRAVMQAKHAPAPALAKIQTLDFGPDGQTRMLKVIQNWATIDPEGAATWASSVPNTAEAGEFWGKAEGSIARLWADRDPDKALAWVTALPAGDARDAAKQELAQALITFFPKRSFELLATLPPAKQAGAENIVKSVSSAWLQMDPAAAEPAIRQSQMPEALKTTLLKMRPKS